MMERSCSAQLLRVEGPCEKHVRSNGKSPTNFDHARANKVEIPMIAVTTHNQSEAPTERRRSAEVGLTWTGLTIVYSKIGSECESGSDGAYGRCVG